MRTDYSKMELWFAALLNWFHEYSRLWVGSLVVVLVGSMTGASFGRI